MKWYVSLFVGFTVGGYFTNLVTTHEMRKEQRRQAERLEVLASGLAEVYGTSNRAFESEIWNCTTNDVPARRRAVRTALER